MRALVSVHDKTGLVPFVQRLVEAEYEIVGSGGTAETIISSGLPVTSVTEVTGSPEVLSGRVKTLHPRIHAGILARGSDDDEDLQSIGARRFDLVVCNLYPFAQTLASSDDETEVIEMIDIGGPALIRAAAKNHRFVTVVTSPSQYEMVIEAIEAGGLDAVLRRKLAAEAFFRAASYDADVVGWLGDDIVLPLRRVAELRYGENPHQEATLVREHHATPWWAEAVIHQGKEMSFNNYLDTEAAWRLAHDLGKGSAVVVKHTIASGAARAQTMVESFRGAWEGDALAAFGGVVALVGRLDVELATELETKFIEVAIATDTEAPALEILSAKPNLRVLTAPAPTSTTDYRRVDGGFLVQTPDTYNGETWETVSEREPTTEEMNALGFAWKVAAHAKSNAVVLARGEQAVGVGAGDQSRVGAAQRAVVKAGDRAKGAVAASDAFFPFRDGLDTLAEAGVTAVVQPGGSRNDQELIDAADEHGIALVFTAVRHFRH